MDAPQTSEIRPGLWRIRLPFHLELNHVNVYLIRLAAEGGWMMVDTGFGNNESWEALGASLDAIGVTWREVRELFITHTHPDHWGLAPRILAESGAKLTMHAIEAANLRRLAEAVHKPSVLDKRLRSWGTPEDQILRITGAFLNIRQRFDAIVPGRVLQGGETIETEALGPMGGGVHAGPFARASVLVFGSRAFAHFRRPCVAQDHAAYFLDG